MQFNITTDYAIRTVLYLAMKNRLATAAEISEAMHIPKNYQLKVTAQAIQIKGFATQSEAYRMLDEEIKGGTLQEINRGSEN